mmetsp:Transcript_12741/g.21967  ORF Transcript_12741/g.21967 Transcript_12741/m.21967 type:complete len:108 (-) Transcript_12741:1070-1393(-)
MMSCAESLFRLSCVTGCTAESRLYEMSIRQRPQQLSHIPQLATPFRSIEGTTQEHRRAPSGAIKAGLFRVAPSQLMLDQETEEKHHQGQGLRGEGGPAEGCPAGACH